MRVLAVVFIGLALGQVAYGYGTPPTGVSSRPTDPASPVPIIVKPVASSLNGQCSGDPVCYARYISPVYQEPKYTCPEGFLLGNYYGEVKCLKKTHSCGKGLTLTSDYKCCEACPANCQQKGGYCYAPPSQVCGTQKTACDPDCEQTLLCPGKGKYGLGGDKKKDGPMVVVVKEDPAYAPVDCVYQCCKTQSPAFPINCYASKVDVEWCDPTVLCPKGSALDPDSGKCLLHQGGWAKCPATNGTLCKCGNKPFCTSAKSYFGIEACTLFCGCLDSLKPKVCDPVTVAPLPGSSPYPGKLASLGQKIDQKIDAIGDALAQKFADKATAEAEKAAAFAAKAADKAAAAAAKAAAKQAEAAAKEASDPAAATITYVKGKGKGRGATDPSATGGKYGQGASGASSSKYGSGAGSAASGLKAKLKAKVDPKKSKYNTADAASNGYGY